MVAHPGTRSSSLNFGPPCMKNGVMGNSPVDQAVIGQVTDELTLQAVRGSHVAAKGTAC
jgi:hypothetical protein